MPPEQLDTLLSFFKALADESRLRMIGLLANRECSVEEIAAMLEVKEPTVSHHLNRLKELNLVTMRAEGNVHLYRLNPESLHTMSKDLLTPETLAGVAGADLDEDKYAQKVLRSFMENGRLKEIPAQRKKRDIILKWLVGHFEPGRKYPEVEVNEVIKRYHDDYATLRREFIMTRLMERADGYYWRP